MLVVLSALYVKSKNITAWRWSLRAWMTSCSSRSGVASGSAATIASNRSWKDL
jgi:hypothetical protein